MLDDGQTTRCPHQNGRRVHQPLTVRALLATDRIIVSTEGQYLLDIADFDSFPEGFEEHYCKKVAQRLAAQYGVNATHFTLRNSLSCDGIPFYTGFHDDHPFYNRTRIYR